MRMMDRDMDADFADLDDNEKLTPVSSDEDVCPFQVPYTPGPGAIDVSVDKDGGVKKEILKEGHGDDGPGYGDKVKVHYTGRLAADGSKFDSSRDSGRLPFEFSLGKGEVIKAWDQGVASMKAGEVARFTCRSDLAYGARGSPPSIPPDADLIFDVELLSWKGEDLSKANDGGIIRTIITPTKNFLTPNEGSLVKIHAVGKHEGRVFFDKDLEFHLELNETQEVPPGVEEALYKFHKGEKAILKLAPAYGFGPAGKAEFGIPPNASLVYEVELRDFVKAKDRWEMDNEEKLKQAALYKKLGTDFLQRGDYKAAEAKYKKAVDFLDDGGAESTEEKKSREELLLSVRLNLSLVALKTNEMKTAVEQCSKALELDPDNEKALFRRGQALLAMHEPENALVDFTKVTSLNAENKAAANQIAVCKRKIAEFKERDKKIFKKMFQLYSASSEEGKDGGAPCPNPDVWKAGAPAQNEVSVDQNGSA